MLHAFNTQAEGGDLRRRLVRGFRDVLRPIAAEVKAAYSGKHLRPLLRRATSVYTKGGFFIGAGIRVDGRKMPSGMHKIPQYWEGEGTWRHPVFNNREVWVTQAPHPSFYAITGSHDEAAGRKVGEILDEIKSEVE